MWSQHKVGLSSSSDFGTWSSCVVNRDDNALVLALVALKPSVECSCNGNFLEALPVISSVLGKFFGQDLFLCLPSVHLLPLLRVLQQVVCLLCLSLPISPIPREVSTKWCLPSCQAYLPLAPSHASLQCIGCWERRVQGRSLMVFCDKMVILLWTVTVQAAW